VLAGISTLAIGDVNFLSGNYIPPLGFSWNDMYYGIPPELLFTDAIPPAPVQSWYLSLMNIVLYLLLAWYLTSMSS
jgi:hypothetical protein